MFDRIFSAFSAWTPGQKSLLVKFPDAKEAAKRLACDESRSKQIVAFHTRDKFYESEARRMLSSATRLGLNVNVSQIESSGSWVRNASRKPTFLLQERLTKRGPLLYVDVDAVFHNDPWPYLSGLDADIAVYYSDPDTKYDGKRVLVSATIMLNDTLGALELLKEWKRRCDANPDIYDQKVLQEILEEGSVDVSHSDLPGAFCWIFDRQDKTVDKVYIEQLQASRELNTTRRFVKKKKLRRRNDRISQIERALEIA